jgi:hypothetical protein
VAGTAGDLIRWYDSSGLGRTYQGGGLIGVVLDGASSTGATHGLHLGDIFHFYCQFTAQNFAGGKGAWFDNQYLYSEQLLGSIFAQNSLANVVFDNSTGVSLSASATGSFDRCNLSIGLSTGGKGDGVVFQGGAICFDGNIEIYGNMASSVTAQYAALLITGSNGAGSSSLNTGTTLNIGVELSDVTHTVPMTIKWGASGNSLTGVSGILDFGANQAFTASNRLGNYSFSGMVYGDSGLALASNAYPVIITPKSGLALGAYTAATAISTASTIFPGTGTKPYVPVSSTGACTGLILGGGSVDGQLLVVVNTTAFSLTFAASGTSHVADGVSDVIPALTARSYYWDNGTSLWYRAA